MPVTVGFIGLGNLGLPIASNLVKSGYTVRVFNRTREKAKPLADLGATIVSEASEAATPGGVVITLLSDDLAVKQVADDTFVKALGQGGIHISMSTISPDTSRELSAHHQKHGVTYIAAPVFARPEAAAARMGFVCTSGGAQHDRDRIKPFLTDAVAKQIIDFGDEPGAANVVKLVGNFMLAASIEMMAEAFTLAEKNGLPAQTVYEMLTSTLFNAPVFQNYGRILVQQQFEPASFRLALGLKDINLLLDTAQKSSTPMPLADLIRDRLQKSMKDGEGDLDWSAFTKQVGKTPE
jgi:3-hydroxyisobutyrate dehydrogenase-like beta-hydroxyacid dehydrogenase